ncbi:hypothetical protein GYMLUDRAFT_65475 [Collybiopsis luxurians FD-317 M1]|uniref:Uncharacterized protein n=1 Tax=Collybiopsis luxurians FD-317 M1 TaxID=944289 RepID=A0A0D0B7B9_9AGAR|nr:hypothetical protein GYMLUDRAFT_65475 [Collybiopsis luxurians FD-317 M1]
MNTFDAHADNGPQPNAATNGQPYPIMGAHSAPQAFGNPGNAFNGYREGTAYNYPSGPTPAFNFPYPPPYNIPSYPYYTYPMPYSTTMPLQTPNIDTLMNDSLSKMTVDSSVAEATTFSASEKPNSEMVTRPSNVISSEEHACTRTISPIPQVANNVTSAIGTWIPVHNRSGPEHCHFDGSCCLSYREHEMFAIIDEDASYRKAFGIMQAWVVDKYFEEKKKGNLDPFGVMNEPEIHSTHYIPHAMCGAGTNRCDNTISIRTGHRNHLYKDNKGFNKRESKNIDDSVHIPKEIIERNAEIDSSDLQFTVGSVPGFTTKNKQRASRYHPGIGTIDPEPFADASERYVSLRLMHFRPGHALANGFVFDIAHSGKLLEAREKLRPRTYDLTEKPSAQSIFTQANQLGNLNGLYAMIDIHHGISLRRRLEQESGHQTITSAECIVEAQFRLPSWAKRSTNIDGLGFYSKESPYAWESISVPSVDQPKLIESSSHHWAYWLATHGNILDHPGVMVTDSGIIDTNTIEGYRLLHILDPSYTSEQSLFRELFITILALPQLYGQLIEFNHLMVAPEISLTKCPFEPRTLGDVAHHMTSCGLTEHKVNSLLQYSQLFCLDKIHVFQKSKRDSDAEVWLQILRRSNLRMLIADCVPQEDPALTLPEHWDHQQLMEYCRRKMVTRGQKTRDESYSYSNES